MTYHSDTRIAFITGANRGIGLETAKQLGQLGIFPVIGARSAAAGLEAVRALKAQGIDADSLVFDLESHKDHQAAYNYFELAAGRLDILINNAAVYLDGEAGVRDFFTAVDVPQDLLRRTMEVNFLAPIAVTQALLPLLKNSKGGRIVNLSSELGSLTRHQDPSSPIAAANSIAYDASKTALNAFTVHLAKVLSETTVKVNSANPGWVKTSMGGDLAPMSVVDGAKTSVRLATLSADGPTGGFFHMDQPLPW